jgi:hypothetical protein
MIHTTPRPLPMHEIARFAERTARDTSLFVCHAGSTKPLPPPGGLGEILRKSKAGNKMIPGITPIKNAAAFRAPAFVTTNTVEKDGFQRRHYAQVQPTRADDVVHESFYAAPGDHLQPGKVETVGGRRLQRYWRISKDMSDLIQRGEQEHLDDAQRAFELTYKKIADEINALTTQKFGPADNPAAAEALALAALGLRLPKELGTDPANWVRVLDRLLALSITRDTKGWHYVEVGGVVTEKDRIVDVVQQSTFTNIGVASSKVVNY